MEHLNITNIVLAICGLIIYALIKYKGRTDKSGKFSIMYWLRDNWTDVVIAVLSTVAIMFMLDEITSLFNIESPDGMHSFEKISSFLGGLFNYAIIDRLRKKFFNKE